MGGMQMVSWFGQSWIRALARCTQLSSNAFVVLVAHWEACRKLTAKLRSLTFLHTTWNIKHKKKKVPHSAPNKSKIWKCIKQEHKWDPEDLENEKSAFRFQLKGFAVISWAFTTRSNKCEKASMNYICTHIHTYPAGTNWLLHVTYKLVIFQLHFSRELQTYTHTQTVHTGLAKDVHTTVNCSTTCLQRRSLQAVRANETGVC